MKVLLGRSASVRVLGVGWFWLDSVFFVFDDGAVDRVRILSLCIQCLVPTTCIVEDYFNSQWHQQRSICQVVYLEGVKMEDASEIVASRVITPTRRACLSAANHRCRANNA